METWERHEDIFARTFSGLRTTGSVQVGSLTLHPLVGDGGGDAPDLLRDVLSAGTLTVEETSLGGSVPELLVTNVGERPVLILEGDELIGLKQNRTVNSSVLVKGGDHVVLPVSCVERGRWSRSSRLSRSTATSHLSLRRLKSRSVHASLRHRQGHVSDQNAVWSEVERMLRHHGHASDTDSLHDARLLLAPQLADFQGLSGDLPVATRGVIVGIGGKPAALELLSDHETFSRVAERLVYGYAMDAIEHPRYTEERVGDHALQDLLRRLSSIPTELHESVGSGRDLRFEDGDVSGYALLAGERVLHAAAFFG